MRVSSSSGVAGRLRLGLVALAPLVALVLVQPARAQYEMPEDLAKQKPQPVQKPQPAQKPQAQQGQQAPSVPAPAAEPGVPGPAPDFSQAPESYTVQKGDTLWDISQKVLGNPWYWPKVWSLNPQVENPNWIYPGNVITFSGGGEQLPAQVQGQAQQGQGPDFGTPEEVAANQQVVSGPRSLTYVPKTSAQVVDRGFITPRELASAGMIAASYEPKSLLSTFDEVYLTFKNRAAVKVGDRFIAFKTERAIHDPRTGALVGYFTKLLGTVRVTRKPGRGALTGEVGSVLDAVERGDRLMPYTDAFTRTVVNRPNQVELDGIILATLKPQLVLIGEYNYVFIDKGRKDGVEVGNTFTILHRGNPLNRDQKIPDKALPWEPVGTAMVVEVRDDASTALILRSAEDMATGDRAVMRVSGQRQAAR